MEVIKTKEGIVNIVTDDMEVLIIMEGDREEFCRLYYDKGIPLEEILRVLEYLDD